MLIIGIFQQFDPQTQAADLYRVGVDIDTKKAIFDNCLLFVKKGLLDTLALFAFGVVIKKYAIIVSNDQFVVFYNHTVFFEAQTFPVEQYSEVTFYCDDFIKGRNQKMPGTYCRIANLKAVQNGIGLFAVFDFVINPCQVGTIPFFYLVEFLDHGLADGFAAHVHGDKTGSKERSVLIAVDLFKNQTKHRCVDEPLVLFLDLFAPLAGEIVGVQEFKNVFNNLKLPSAFVPEAVFDNC